MSAAKAPGLVGRKAGMTRVFTEAGETVPVTVIEAMPNRVTQVRTVETDGYRAVQVAVGDRGGDLDQGDNEHDPAGPPDVVRVAAGDTLRFLPPLRSFPPPLRLRRLLRNPLILPSARTTAKME